MNKNINKHLRKKLEAGFLSLFFKFYKWMNVYQIHHSFLEVYLWLARIVQCNNNELNDIRMLHLDKLCPCTIIVILVKEVLTAEIDVPRIVNLYPSTGQNALVKVIIEQVLFKDGWTNLLFSIGILILDNNKWFKILLFCWEKVFRKPIYNWH